jgi:hypothetical protein
MTEKSKKDSSSPDKTNGPKTRKDRASERTRIKDQKEKNGKPPGTIVLDDSDSGEKEKNEQTGTDDDRESESENARREATKTPPRPSSAEGSSESGEENGNSDVNKLKKEAIETDQEKAMKAKTLNISLDRYKTMEKEEPELLKLMYETCVNAEKRDGPSVFSELGLTDDLGYQLAYMLGMSMSEFEYNMRQRPEFMQNVVLQNISSPEKERRLNSGMGLRVLSYIKKKMAEQSAKSALPSGNASVDRGPAYAGYVRPSYGVNAYATPYVGLYPSTGMVGLYSGPNNAGFSGPGPSTALSYGA